MKRQISSKLLLIKLSPLEIYPPTQLTNFGLIDLLLFYEMKGILVKQSLKSFLELMVYWKGMEKL